MGFFSKKSAPAPSPAPAPIRRQRTSRNWDKSPETEKDTKFHDLRAAGWKGPIDQDGDKARVVGKGRDLRIEKVK